MPRRLTFIVLVPALLLAACGQSTSTLVPRLTPAESHLATPATFSSPVSGSNQPGQGTPKPSPLTQPTVAAPSWPAGADAPVRAAINDLAAQLKTAPENVQVVSVQAIDWPDTSLGCPQPGMFYAQVITPGYKILLATGGQQTEYHADERGRVVKCQ